MRSSIRRAKNWSRLHPQGADMLLTAALSILALVSSRAAVDFAEAAGPPGFDLPTLPQECSAWSSRWGRWRSVVGRRSPRC